jgi:CubicO group peptidase (beta-lactamase class C family)
MSLVERGVLSLATTARSLLGDDLPLVDDAVTIEHLLAHRSGIGDYFREDDGGDVADHVLEPAVHRFDTTEHYLPALADRPPLFAPGTAFSYCNSGFVILALVAERATGTAFPLLVDDLVCRPAGMVHTAFLRSDELPGDAALGYLAADGLRSNLLHLPVVGSGDGGVWSTVDDVHALWPALFAGRIVGLDRVAEMVRPRSATPSGQARYGLGFWLKAHTDAVELEGYDAGVSFRSVHQPSSARTYTVMANTSEGAWPVVQFLEGAFIVDRP